jgi:hypothetical protein
MAKWLCLSALAFAIGAACTKPNPSVCCTSPADCSSLNIDEDSRVCATGLVCVAHECVTPPNACLANDDCSEPTPFCDPGVACVGCLVSDDCPTERPVCDATTRACRACAGDLDCASTLCDISTGACVAEADVLFSSSNGPDAGNCGRLEPCSLTRAIALADLTRYAIKLAPGTYVTKVTLSSKKIVIHGSGATFTSTVADPTVISLQDGANLRLVGLSIIGLGNNGNQAVRCDASVTTPVLEMFRTSIDAEGAGIVGYPCDLVIEESTVRSRSTSAALVMAIYPSVFTAERSLFEGGGRIESLDGTIRISNSVIRKVGSAATHGAFWGSGPFEISYSTIVDTLVECDQSAMNGAKNMTLTSSILFDPNASPTVGTLLGVTSCAKVSYSVIYPAASETGGTNIDDVAPQLKDPANGDYHLESSSPALGRGDPTSTNAIDFDGVVRPQGAARDSGAFEFVP